MSSGIYNRGGIYTKCTRCPLSESRRHIVFGGYGQCSRGTVERDGKLLYYQGEIETGEEPPILSPLKNAPCILFLSEAPGSTEDLVGLPFTGKAGRLFNLCLSYTEEDFTFHITNILGCRPWKEGKKGGKVNRPPTKTEVDACLPRVKSIITNNQIDGIIHVGEFARTAFPSKDSITIAHPSAILRKEYKLHDIRSTALKINNYVSSIRQTRLQDSHGR